MLLEEDRKVDIRRVLAAQYAQRLPVRSPRFVWPTATALLAIQDDIHNDLFETGLPGAPIRYDKSFLKALLERLQQAVDHAVLHDLVAADDLVRRAKRLESMFACLTEVTHCAGNEFCLRREIRSTACSKGSAVRTVGRVRVDWELFAHVMDPNRHHVPEPSTTCYLFPEGAESLSTAPHTPLHGLGNVLVQEEGSFVSAGTTGLQTWEAA